MDPTRFRRISLIVGWLAAVLLGLAVAALLPLHRPDLAPPAWVAGLLLVAGWLSLIVIHEAARSHFERLRRLRSGIEAVAHGQLFPQAIAEQMERDQGPMGEMARLVAGLSQRRHHEAAKPDRRLAAVLRAIHDGVVVITESGLISLINGPAKRVLGGGHMAIGGSIYAAVDRNSLLAALQRGARSGGKAVGADLVMLDGLAHPVSLLDLGEHRGSVIIFPSDEQTAGHEVEFALDLHDQPPAAPPPADGTLLAELPVVVLDTETTGLDSSRDSIISVGAVRCHGARLYRSTVLDLLVNPGRHIPARSTAVHGISDSMVSGKAAIAEILPEVLAFMAESVVVGHSIGFDLALLERAVRGAGLEWRPPQRLDILLLAAALSSEETGFEIDDQAARMGINITGRHTALGDSLVTAEIWVRLVPQLERRGIRTLGEARAFSRKAAGQWSRQKDMGWDEDTQLRGKP
ncbi:DNA polymerase III subunit epsilon [Paramagnetospirillum caucaseum]|uniref:DNA polymerase III subunit epsilon n=1 Tax=Paramagnetospirillum caucaseum TaxID=1244869 RepID=M3AHH9_9PROT|nr:exonuclease domain-containing protein [Paramagnetospirillum caucaseum]EME72009.1 DNA polymerase III subunit epsilon [Paramagnetospirillum caucaseum]